jgi:hypothetical protein
VLCVITFITPIPDPATLTTVGRSVVAMQGRRFLLAPGFVVFIGNGLGPGYLMFRSGLVLRRMAMLRLVGVR